MAQRWLNLDQLQDLTDWSKRRIQQKVKAGELRWRRSQHRCANGRDSREYALLSLAPELQIKFIESTPSVAVSSEEPEKKTGQLIQFRPLPAVEDSPRMPATQAHKDQIDFRITVIKPLIDYLALRTKAERNQWCMQEGWPVGSADELAKQIATNHGLGRATIWRWYRTYKESGAAELFDRPRGQKGVSRWFTKYPDAGALAAFTYLEQGQSMTCAWEAINRNAAQLGIPEDDLPSYETVRSALKSIPPAWRILAREGRKKYREMCAPYVSRGYTEPANLIWVSDHAIFDVEVMNDCFPEQPFGTPIRLRLTVILDFRSRFVVGYSFAWEGSSRSIGTALRRAICDHGPCELFYCDNGKDYLKVARGAIPGYLIESPLTAEKWYERELADIENLGILARCKIAVTHCIVRHPQSKHVERFFRTMHERFDRKWWTYTGGSPDRRPDLTEQAMAAHRKLMRHGQVERSQHPRASLFMCCFTNWLEEYHNKEHRGRGMEGRTPAQVFAEERNPNQRPAPDQSVMATMLHERKTCLVQECAIRHANRRYVPFDGASHETMHRLNRTNVVVGYDENDPEAVVVLADDGSILTWLKAEEYLPQSRAAGPAIAESMRMGRHLEKETRRTLRGITLAARSIGAKSEVERMSEAIWELPAAVNDHVTHSTKRVRPDVNARAPQTAATIAREILEAIK